MREKKIKKSWSPTSAQACSITVATASALMAASECGGVPGVLKTEDSVAYIVFSPSKYFDAASAELPASPEVFLTSSGRD